MDNAFTIAMAIQHASKQFVSISDTSVLDAEVLLANLLQVSRSYLFAFSERELTSAEIHSFQKLVEQRKQNIPIAYILGHKEFWSLDLKVTQDTLIPRPETEQLVECVLQQINGENKIIADLGTGSGAIALALAYERPSWEIHAVDVSAAALDVAKLNAKRLKLSQIIFHHSDWLSFASGMKFDAIVSNPPYIAADDPHLQYNNVRFEPRSALIADESGLKDIRHIINQARHHLQPGGKLFIEHGFLQAEDVRSIFANLGYSDVNTYHDLAGLDRVTSGAI